MSSDETQRLHQGSGKGRKRKVEQKTAQDVSLPLSPEEAKRRMNEVNAVVMFEKVLTLSDTSGSGRIVIPKVGHSEEMMKWCQ